MLLIMFALQSFSIFCIFLKRIFCVEIQNKRIVYSHPVVYLGVDPGVVVKAACLESRK